MTTAPETIETNESNLRNQLAAIKRKIKLLEIRQRRAATWLPEIAYLTQFHYLLEEKNRILDLLN